jgi:hypothetical protein
MAQENLCSQQSCTDKLAATTTAGCCRHGTSEGLLIHDEGGRYESVKQNDSDVSDDDKFAELYSSTQTLRLHFRILYFISHLSFSFSKRSMCLTPAGV